MELYLRDDLADAWQGSDPFDAAAALSGHAVREVASRSTIRTTIAGATYYAKRHRGVGWPEILKNWFSGRAPVLDASNEYRAIDALRAAGLHTLTVAGYGRRGANPATRQSFLVTEELTPILSLEQLCLRWLEQPPQPVLKRVLIERVAQIARSMHGAGVNHRDFYLCHLLLHEPASLTADTARVAAIHVVDLHRAQLRTAVPRRWLVKDLGSLHFSAFEIGLTSRDVLRFVRTYFGRPLREVLSAERSLLSDADRRAARLYQKAKTKQILPRQLAGIDR